MMIRRRRNPPRAPKQYDIDKSGRQRTSDGKNVKWGKVYRSDNLHSLTDEDVKYMERLNLKSVVDFRSDEERNEEPDRLTPDMTPILLPIKFEPEGVTETLMRDLTFGDLDSSSCVLPCMFVRPKTQDRP